MVKKLYRSIRLPQGKIRTTPILTFADIKGLWQFCLFGLKISQNKQDQERNGECKLFEAKEGRSLPRVFKHLL